MAKADKAAEGRVMIQLDLEKRHHAARLKDSERLQRLDRFLIDKGKAGASTYEIMAACNTGGVSRDVDELRKNGINVVCKYEGRSQNGRKLFRYFHPAFLALLLLASCKVVTPDEMRRAAAACKAHGGLNYIRVSPFAESTETNCVDGTVIAKLPERGKK